MKFWSFLSCSHKEKPVNYFHVFLFTILKSHKPVPRNAPRPVGEDLAEMIHLYFHSCIYHHAVIDYNTTRSHITESFSTCNSVTNRKRDNNFVVHWIKRLEQSRCPKANGVVYFFFFLPDFLPFLPFLPFFLPYGPSPRLTITPRNHDWIRIAARNSSASCSALRRAFSFSIRSSRTTFSYSEYWNNYIAYIKSMQHSISSF